MTWLIGNNNRVNFMNHCKQLILLVSIVVLIAGCVGNNKKSDVQGQEVAKQAVSDVTTPPNSLDNSVDAIEESNPDETVSYEKWKRKQSERSKPTPK